MLAAKFSLLSVSFDSAIFPLPIGLSLLSLQDNAGLLQKVGYYLNREFQFGSIKLSLATLLEGFAVLAVAILLSRSIKKLLQRRIAQRAYIDPGIRYTIGRLAQYLIVALGIIFALQAAFNLNLAALAVVFTALSLGIGFGLQYIAADIASGFILLFERPVRIGDRITIGEDEGDVQSINLRTTIVLTNDRISIIVPNSRLISQRLINWSYGDPRARLSIPVGVAYGSDVELVTMTLLQAATDIENVLSDPTPKVQFLKFGDFSMDFRLMIWTNRPRVHAQIRSDINYRIDKLFREAGIEIPFPTQEFRLRGGSVHLDPAERPDSTPLDQPGSSPHD
ncbi:MAG: mechanosensitive ion channel domain-containing protein [Pyrinomonadaceae bacterium]